MHYRLSKIKSKVVLDTIMWWDTYDTYGASCPTVQWLASRILPETTLAAVAESAWPQLDFIFNRNRCRNRMGKKRSSPLVCAHCNTRLLRQFKKVAYVENWVQCRAQTTKAATPKMTHAMDIDKDLECQNNKLYLIPCLIPLCNSKPMHTRYICLRYTYLYLRYIYRDFPYLNIHNN